MKLESDEQLVIPQAHTGDINSLIFDKEEKMYYFLFYTLACILVLMIAISMDLMWILNKRYFK